MSKLLKGKCVFIDTQAFRRARFGVADPAFEKLSDLCEHGEVTLLTTAITRREIEAQIEETAQEMRSTLTKAAAIALSLGEPEIFIFGVPANKITEIQIITGVKGLVNKFFNRCLVEELELPNTALSDVLDLYFQKQPPFGAGKKKAEFPDAFVLQALKAKAGSNGKSIYVITEDNDFESACKEIQHLEHLPTISHYLDRYNSHAEVIKQVRATLRRNSKKIDEKLDDIFSGIPGELIDCPGSVKFSHKKIVDILDSLVISCNEGNASVEFVCLVEMDAHLEIQPSTFPEPEYRFAEKGYAINITLDFRFDPNNPNVFELETYWAPRALQFSGHDGN